MKMTIFHWFLMSLAAFRLTLLITKDEGPFDVFKRLRARIKFLGCPFCVSVWVGAGLQAGYCLTVTPIPVMVAACSALALSSVAIILDRTFTSNV